MGAENHPSLPSQITTPQKQKFLGLGSALRRKHISVWAYAYVYYLCVWIFAIWIHSTWKQSCLHIHLHPVCLNAFHGSLFKSWNSHGALPQARHTFPAWLSRTPQDSTRLQILRKGKQSCPNHNNSHQTGCCRTSSWKDDGNGSAQKSVWQLAGLLLGVLLSLATAEQLKFGSDILWRRLQRMRHQRYLHPNAQHISRRFEGRKHIFHYGFHSLAWCIEKGLAEFLSLACRLPVLQHNKQWKVERNKATV